MKTDRLIRAVQTCRRKVAGLADDEAWRGFLEQHAGKRSLKAMNGPELGRVLDALHAAGAPRAPGKGAGTTRRLADDDQAKMIRGLWLELHRMGRVGNPSETAIGAFVKRQTGIERLEWLDSRAANKVIEGLKAMKFRAWAQEAADGMKPLTELRAECEALWERLRELGAVTFEQSDVQGFGYRVTGVAAFLFYGADDYVKLLARLRGWVRAAEKEAAAG